MRSLLNLQQSCFKYTKTTKNRPIFSLLMNSLFKIVFKSSAVSGRFAVDNIAHTEAGINATDIN